MKFTELQKYKHDTIGKFQTLKELIESLSESNISTPEAREILEAADEVFETMSSTSKEMIRSLILKNN